MKKSKPSHLKSVPATLRIPKWVEPSLQGLCFWIGLNYTRFRFWPMTEGALVAEFQRLVHSNINEDEVLLAEQSIANLVGTTTARDCEFGHGRVDVVIAKKRRDGNVPMEHEVGQYVTAVIEVKRAGASSKQIYGDLQRLSKLAGCLKNRSARYYLIIGSQAGPIKNRFVKGGKATRGKQIIRGACIAVRRVCKATTTFDEKKGINKAHYACLIEAFPS